MNGTALIYLDNIGVPSEVSFLKRFYVGFERLAPVWVSWRKDRDAHLLPGQQIVLGRGGLRRTCDRLLFKTAGALPPIDHIARLNPQIIHAHFGRGGALALPLARALNVPLVVTFHGGDATKEKHYKRRGVLTIYQRRLAALQDYAVGIHCVSEYIRDTLLRRGFPEEKLFVLRTGVELTPSDHLSDTANAGRYALFVGRLVEKKGVTYLIEAMHRLRQRGESIPLVVIGEGPLAEPLRRQAAGLADVRFLDWQPNHEVRRWMRDAAAVCIPSIAARTGDSEGLGHVVMEAMDAGTPVVASRHGGISELVEHGVSGFLTAPGDASAIAEALAAVAADEGLRQTLGTNARAVALERFDAVRQSRDLEKWFLSLAGATA